MLHNGEVLFFSRILLLFPLGEEAKGKKKSRRRGGENPHRKTKKEASLFPTVSFLERFMEQGYEGGKTGTICSRKMGSTGLEQPRLGDHSKMEYREGLPTKLFPSGIAPKVV